MPYGAIYLTYWLPYPGTMAPMNDPAAGQAQAHDLLQ